MHASCSSAGSSCSICTKCDLFKLEDEARGEREQLDIRMQHATRRSLMIFYEYVAVKKAVEQGTPQVDQGP